jgi:hypothetical protein
VQQQKGAKMDDTLSRVEFMVVTPNPVVNCDFRGQNPSGLRANQNPTRTHSRLPVNEKYVTDIATPHTTATP